MADRQIAAESAEDVTEATRARTDMALRESEERLRLALEAGRMGTWRYELASGRQQWSAQQFRLFGLAPDAAPPTRELFLSLVHPDDHRLVEFGPEHLRPGGGLLDAAFRIVRPDGEIRWLVAHTTVRRDASGAAVEMIGVNWDITEARRAETALATSEAELRVLVAELQHRTRNLLGLVRSLAERTARTSLDLADFLANYGNRLAALGRAQALLSRSEGHHRVAFDELLRTELQAHGADRSDRVVLAGPTGVKLSSATVQLLALAIHELATNAGKHGALSQPHGRLEIDWRVAGEPPRLHVLWRETGVTVSEPAGRRSGGGRELIEHALPYQLAATTKFELTANGLLCTLELPISVPEGEAQT